ncbi:CcdB family protein [Yoonia sp.]|uniref:CcdB family protein n=1 Tax=Yoonia sp. TaxID=2212373 RepID=UPI002DF8C164|nr:CcdB family protein [Yoonia sp.]
MTAHRKRTKTGDTTQPTFDNRGERVVMAPQFMAAVPAGLLTFSNANIEVQFDKVTAAIDMLVQGC